MASTSSFYSLAPFSGIKSSARRSRPSRVSAAYASTSTAANSLYDVLGIDTSANFQEIKQAYRKLARVSHPDVACSGDGEFIRIHSAYSTLSDPEKRADYDRTMFVNTRSRVMSASDMATTSYGYSTMYGSRRWETDQCW